MGYNDGKLNNFINGTQIAERLGDDHSGIEDFNKLPTSVSSGYDAFLKQLEQYASSEALNHPLASCYKVGHEYFKKQNDDEITAAINAIKEELLLKGVQGSGSGLGLDIDKVTEVLGNGQSGLIGKLAEGLQQFIGYDGSQGTMKHNSKGIGASNDPLERLQDGVLGFLAEVFGTLNSAKMFHGIYATGIAIAYKEALNKKNARTFQSVVQNELTNLQSHSISNVVDKLKQVKQLNETSVDQLANGFNTYVFGVLEEVKKTASTASNQVEELKSSLDTLLTDLQSQKANKPFNFGKDPVDTQQPLKTQLDAVVQANNELSDKLISHTGNKTAQALCTAVYSGTDEFLWHLEKAYVSYYQGTKVDTSKWDSDNIGEAKTCAQIFLGCIPLIYHCLTQLYWLCHDSGPWDGQRFHDPRGSALSNIMVALGYGDYYLNSQQGKIVVKSAMQRFNEFKAIQLEGPNAHLKTPYHAFLNKLTSNLNSAINPSSSDLSGHTIPALYHIARLYFRHQHGYDDYLRVVVAERLEFHLLAEVLVVLGGDPDLNYGDAVLAFVTRDDVRAVELDFLLRVDAHVVRDPSVLGEFPVVDLVAFHFLDALHSKLFR
ncbi:variant erythrocyte surface antigen-1 family protein [Babesia caballi]|uniref:Variant erythrocyte surface antigen-1 family protein n=1 Tax=Babesia caballi TaxID=5871 RepID=A0AAV4LTW2_BABCB|nr:variant erythrocyte surface antigen-1 family protein [Babesia caballi]